MHEPTQEAHYARLYHSKRIAGCSHESERVLRHPTLCPPAVPRHPRTTRANRPGGNLEGARQLRASRGRRGKRPTQLRQRARALRPSLVPKPVGATLCGCPAGLPPISGLARRGRPPCLPCWLTTHTRVVQPVQSVATPHRVAPTNRNFDTALPTLP